MLYTIRELLKEPATYGVRRRVVRDTFMKKICSHCKKEKDLSQFILDKSKASGFKSHCKECHVMKQKGRIRTKKTLDSTRNAHLVTKFGITIEDYNELFIKQKGCCAICGKHQSVLNKRLAVDHCHSTGEIRHLLCNKCNLGIGYFNDDVKLLKNAIDYLEEHSR